MQNETIVAKWGTGLAVRIPEGLVEAARIQEGDQYLLSVQADGSLLLRSARCHYELADLVAGITEHNLHLETEWNGPVGKEVW